MKELPHTNAVTSYGLLNAVIRVTIDDFRRMVMKIVCLRGKSIQKHVNWHLSEGEEWFGYKKSPCNAIGCIAGWVLILTGYTSEDERNLSDTFVATKILGLSYSQEKELFFPRVLVRRDDYQTPEYANDVIKHIREFQKKYKSQLQKHYWRTIVE